MIDIDTFLKSVQLAVAVGKFAREIKRSHFGSKATIDTSLTEERLKANMKAIQRWAGTDQVDPLVTPSQLGDIYVDLNVRLASKDKVFKIPRNFTVTDLHDFESSVVLLGQPGAGKTTAVKRLLSMAINSQDASPRFPISVPLRSVRQLESLFDHLCSLAGIRIDLPASESPALRQELQLRTLAKLFDAIDATVFLDGLDEVPGSDFSQVVDHINRLVQHTTHARFFITCRTAAYRHTISGVTIVELGPLTPRQVQRIATKWLTPKKTALFLKKLSATPYKGTELRPLVLANLLLLFLRYGDVPKRPKTVYEKILRLLLEDWDASKNVIRKSQYADFPTDRKEEFLEALAFTLTRYNIMGEFSHSSLVAAYQAIHAQFGLPKTQAKAVAREIESHTGLVKTEGEDEYSFYHLVIQEYLTARYIVRSGVVCPSEIRVSDHPNEYAVAVAYSSDPSAFFREVVQRFLYERRVNRLTGGPSRFEGEFIARLVTEIPNWKHDEAFGAAFCFLASSYAEQHSIALPAWTELINQGPVRVSIDAFMKRYTELADKEVPNVFKVNYPALNADTGASAELVLFLGNLNTPQHFSLPMDVIGNFS